MTTTKADPYLRLLAGVLEAAGALSSSEVAPFIYFQF